MKALKTLLAINVYDKQEWVKAWERQFLRLDPSLWSMQVVCNGPNPRPEWVRAGNNSVTAGYKQALAATVVEDDIDVVVSVHAKTALSDILALNSIVAELLDQKLDGVFLEQEPYSVPCDTPYGRAVMRMNQFQECLFLFALRADRWKQLIAEYSSGDMAAVGTEIGMTKSIERLGLRVKRLPTTGCLTLCANGERATMGVGGRMNVYGTEVAGPFGGTDECWWGNGMSLHLNGIIGQTDPGLKVFDLDESGYEVVDVERYPGDKEGVKFAALLRMRTDPTT